MTASHLTRRQLLAASLAAPLAPGLFAGFSTAARAAGGIVATTSPGTWETAQRQILLPAFTKASGASVTLQPVLALEAVAKISASRETPPFDVVLLDEGPYLAALGMGIFAPLPKDKVTNLASQSERFTDPNGHGAFISA